MLCVYRSGLSVALAPTMKLQLRLLLLLLFFLVGRGVDIHAFSLREGISYENVMPAETPEQALYGKLQPQNDIADIVAPDNSLAYEGSCTLIVKDNESEDEEPVSFKKGRYAKSWATGPDDYFSTAFYVPACRNFCFYRTGLLFPGQHQAAYLFGRRYAVFQVFRI